MNRESGICGALWGAVAGDALGVPVEFMSRDVLRSNPVTGMRGYGTFSQPPGTWSDDTSLMLCTAESLCRAYDLNDMASLFVRWKEESYLTPYGVLFDIGISTRAAIDRMSKGAAPLLSGGSGESDNGNGSLMRILPVALMYYDDIGKMAERACQVSCLTHRHPRSQAACAVYCMIISHMLKGADKREACRLTAHALDVMDFPGELRAELPLYSRALGGNFASLAENEISSSGYVVHTLEAALWCFLNAGSFSEAVLKAVNLGGDTDTTAAVCGGLAGVFYGRESIPSAWVEALARKDMLEEIFSRFFKALPG